LVKSVGVSRVKKAAKYKAYAKLKTMVENDLSSSNSNLYPVKEVARIVPELPTKQKRSSIGDAPMSKADIGQTVDRFAKRILEQQAREKASQGMLCIISSKKQIWLQKLIWTWRSWR
jgi:hypothetical protein